MMDSYDDEIRRLEERLMQEREALAHQADDLTERARALAVSPKGLLAAAAVGFVLGELSRPRHHHHHDSTPRKLGMGGLAGGIALALIRAQYGSPLAFGRAVWDFIATRRASWPAATSSAARYETEQDVSGFPPNAYPRSKFLEEPRIGS